MSEEVVSKETEPTANAAEAEKAATEGQPGSEMNERLLAESKKYKKQYQETKSKLEELEKSKLKEQAQYKELYEKAEDKYQTLYKALVKEKVKTAVTDRASKAGCVDVEALLKLGNTQLLQIDEETLEVQGTDVFVEDAKKLKPYLFGSPKAPTINSATPGGVAKGSQKTIKEMSKDEILAQLRALK
jgi:hypothetical protein